MPTPDTTAPLTLARYFTYRLTTLSKLNDIASQALYQTVGGLGLAEARCLAAIGSFPGLGVKQLAYETNLDKSHASRAAQSLVERALVVRTGKPLDGRSISLTLTEQGRLLCDRLMALIEQRNQDLTQCLSEAEKGLLLDLFDRMLRQASAPDQASGACRQRAAE